MKFWTSMVGLAFALTVISADAARIGGGKSAGRQSANVTQREAAKPAPAPAQNATNNSAQPGQSAASPAAAQPAKRPWGAMLGGLAAGLGLAWLASSLGLGEAFGQILMFGLLALIVMMVIGWVMRNRRAQASPGASGPFAFQGAGGPAGQVTAERTYRPENVGNDASARPWERNSAMGALDASSGPAQRSMIGAALAGSQAWGVPAGFDSDGFLKAARDNFVTLQSAWDRADVGALRSMMTDEMVEEIQAQLADRAAHTGGTGNHTEVVMIDAKLLGIEDLGADYMASVEFSGMIREEPSSGPSPFREVWNMTKPKAGGSGWLVAGVQALQ
jgi:predicted lipid-binding transport protein (Tim44 family)